MDRLYLLCKPLAYPLPSPPPPPPPKKKLRKWQKRHLVTILLEGCETDILSIPMRPDLAGSPVRQGKPLHWDGNDNGTVQPTHTPHQCEICAPKQNLSQIVPIKPSLDDGVHLAKEGPYICVIKNSETITIQLPANWTHFTAKGTCITVYNKMSNVQETSFYVSLFKNCYFVKLKLKFSFKKQTL